MGRAASIIVLSLAIVLSFASAAPAAATWYVLAGSTGDGSLANPFGKIQQAIGAAASGDTVRVAEGTYNENLSINGKSLIIEGGWDSAFGEFDQAAHMATIDGGQKGSCVAYSNGAAGDISGFTLTRGEASHGGGIYCLDSSPTIHHNQIRENTIGTGCGIYAKGANCRPVIANNTISGNRSDGYTGSGLYLGDGCTAVVTGNIITANAGAYEGGGIACMKASATITNNIITNHTAGYQGAAIWAASYFSVTIEGNTIADNVVTGYTSSGGGIFCKDGSATIRSNIVTGNASASVAGGVLVESCPSAIVEGNIITDNVAQSTGGGLRFDYCDSGVIRSNVLSRNSASAGGGLYASGNPILIANNLIVNNCATGAAWGSYGDGGGMYIGFRAHTVVCNTITGNTALRGGGITCSYSSAIISSCIVWGNTAQKAPQLYANDRCTPTVRYSNVAGGAEAVALAYSCSLDWGPGNIETDPLFGDPEHGDYHLQSATGRFVPGTPGEAGAWLADALHSPCIDAGDPALDSSLEPQPNGGRLDMGYYGNTPEASLSYTGSAHLLSIRSTPISGVSFTGTYAGTTDCTVSIPAGTEATVYGWQSSDYYFLRWEDAGGNVLSNCGKITVVMDSDKTLVAVYGAVTDFYVNDAIAEDGIAAGDDACPGTSPQFPMASIQRLLDRYRSLGKGKTVHVSTGRYVENISIWSFHSGLVLAGSSPGRTIVDGNNAGSCLTINGMSAGTVSGFTFTGGNATFGIGGGISCASATLVITNCVITANTAASYGGGIYCTSSPVVTNCTIFGNSAPVGSAIYATAALTIANCIVWNNTSLNFYDETHLKSPASMTVRYCDLMADRVRCEQGAALTLGPGNLDCDPLFADPQQLDFRLKSVGGRWDSTANEGIGDWIQDAEHSPCIDAGDPAAAFSNEPAPNGGRANIGADGNTPTASKSYPGPTRALTVRSTPMSAVSITGSIAGTTDFTAIVPAGQPVVLWGWQAAGKAFLRWERPDGSLISKSGKLSFTPDSDTSVVAVYGTVTDFYANDPIPENGFGPGSESNAGTAPEFPVDSIQRILNRFPSIGTGCTVHVSDGTYMENLVITSVHSGLTLAGAAPEMVIIDGNQVGSCLRLDSFTTGTISGLTFTNGNSEKGAGIACYNSSPNITNNIFRANKTGTDHWGGAIYCHQSSPVVSGNSITENSAAYGSAFYCYGGSPVVKDNTISRNGHGGRTIDCGTATLTISHNTLSHNLASTVICCTGSTTIIDHNMIIANTGSGIWCGGGISTTITNNAIIGNTGSQGAGIGTSVDATIESNTIAGNTARSAGGALYVYAADASASNNIFWANTAPQGPEIYLTQFATLRISYSDVAGGKQAVYNHVSTLTWGAMLMVDPLFADLANNDCHLKSQFGRWDPKAANGAGAWVSDAVTSPCIDAGDTHSSYSNEPQPNGSRINMGAYGNTPEASRKYRWRIAGDANEDCRVNVLDLIFVRNRLGQSSYTADNWKTDFDMDGKVGLSDYIFVRGKLNTKCK